jgi:hypothetical protein
LHEQRVFAERLCVLVDSLGDITTMDAEQQLHQESGAVYGEIISYW